MYLNLKDMIDFARRMSIEPGTTRWTNALTIDLINRGQDFVARKLKKQTPQWFYKQGSISTANTTNNYQLPWDTGKVMRVHVGSYDWSEIPPWKAASYESDPYSATGNMHYYYRGNEIVVAEKTVSSGSTILIEYQRTQLPALHYGTAEAGAATTITLDVTPTVSAVVYGQTMAINDYYNQCQVYIDGGTGLGQINTITDYVGSTRVATVNDTWDTNPSTDSTYSTVSELPADLHHFFYDWAGIKIKASEGGRISNDMAILVEELNDALDVYGSQGALKTVDYIEDIYEAV